MAAITTAQSGNWSATTTWAGGAVPQAGDSFVIANGHAVTLTDTRPVGDLTTAGTVTGTLAIASTGNLVANGELAVSSATGSITAAAGAVIDQSGGAYNLKLNTTTGGTNSTIFTGTADNRVLLKGGTGKIYVGAAAGGTTTNWAYVTVTGYTEATTGINITGNTLISLDHVRFLNTGKIIIGALGTMPGASPYSVTNCDFRGQPAGTLVYFQKKNELSTSTRTISGNTFVSSSAVYNSSMVTTRGIQGFTINDNVFYNIKFLPTSETHSNSFDGNISWVDSTDVSWVAQISFYMGKGNSTFKNGVLAATVVNWHGLNISNAVENTGMSYLEDSVIQSVWGGANESPANVIMLSGNDATVRRNILLGTSSGILPVAASTSNNYIKNNTFVNYGAGTTPSTVRFYALLCEFATRVSGDYVFNNNLMYNNGPSENYGVGGYGGGADLTGADYNVFFNILDANRYSNTTGTWGAHDLAGSVDPQFKYPTRTITTYSQANGGTDMADYFVGAVKKNGLDKDGNAAAFDSAYTSAALLSYIRDGYQPQDATLATAGEGGTFIGAVQPVAAGDPQTITFNPLASTVYGAAPITLTATASSGLPVSYTSSNTAVATVAGSTVTIVGVGSTNITATQAGDGTYAAATPVVQALTVAKADQTISISAPRYKLPTDAAFTVTATATSGLTCTLSILSGPATILDGVVTLTGTLGDVVIRAVQAGDANYNAAAATDRTVSVVEEIPIVKQSNTFGLGFGFGF